MPSIDVPLMTPIALMRGCRDMRPPDETVPGPYSMGRWLVQSGMRLDHDRSLPIPYTLFECQKGRKGMLGTTLRSVLSAGVMMAAVSTASAQVLEVGLDMSPTGLDP